MDKNNEGTSLLDDSQLEAPTSRDEHSVTTKNIAKVFSLCALMALVAIASYSHASSQARSVADDSLQQAPLGHRHFAKPDHRAILMDLKTGPLNADMRNAGLGEKFVKPTTDVPDCMKTCVLDGLSGIEFDSSYCLGLQETDVVDGHTSVDDCLQAECDAAGLAAVEAIKNEVCEESQAAQTAVSDASALGLHRVGSIVASDAKPELMTWQCDFKNCHAFAPRNVHHPGKGGIFQYVDNACGYGGGVGCEGAHGGQTRCRACYLGKNIHFKGSLGYPQCPMCICQHLNVNATKCILCSGFYKFFKFSVNRVRGGHNGNPTASSANAMQFAELKLIDMHGDIIPIDTSSSQNPGGNNPFNGLGSQPPYDQGPYAAVEGTLEKKFLDSNFQANGQSSLIFAVDGDPVMIRGYEFFTADDCPSRDPIEWELSGADDVNGPWMRFSYITNGKPPSSRLSSYGVFDPCHSN